MGERERERETDNHTIIEYYGSLCVKCESLCVLCVCACVYVCSVCVWWGSTVYMSPAVSCTVDCKDF